MSRKKGWLRDVIEEACLSVELDLYIKALPRSKRQEVLDYLKTIVTRKQYKAAKKIWQIDIPQDFSYRYRD